jgi:hypothetical protein
MRDNQGFLIDHQQYCDSRLEIASKENLLFGDAQEMT